MLDSTGPLLCAILSGAEEGQGGGHLEFLAE